MEYKLILSFLKILSLEKKVKIQKQFIKKKIKFLIKINF